MLTLISVIWNCFNPRTYIRYDDEDGNAFKVDFVSIHVPI